MTTTTTGATMTRRSDKVDGGTFASRLAARLKQLDVSYAELGEAAGVSKQAVGQWCAGEGAPSDRAAIKAAEALGVAVAWLLHGEGPKGRSGPLTPVSKRQASLRRDLRAHEAAAKLIRAELRALSRERDEAEERAWARPARGPRRGQGAVRRGGPRAMGRRPEGWRIYLQRGIAQLRFRHEGKRYDVGAD